MNISLSKENIVSVNKCLLKEDNITYRTASLFCLNEQVD